MPVAGQRDPEQVKAVLKAWIARQEPGATDVEVTNLHIPQGNGFSNETYLFDASWSVAGTRTEAELVLRSQPATHHLFPEIDLITQQYLSMKLLRDHSDVPVANVRWAERDDTVLGGPFFVMDRLHGVVPTDAPPYTQEGFVVEMTPEQRATWARNGIEAMTRVAKVDWQAAGFDHLNLLHHGALGPEQRRNYFHNYLQWAWGDREHPVIHAAWAWLDEHWPADGNLVELCWGDARPGNQMYGGDDHTEVIAIFDWEMVSLGNSESDLGWWLFLQEYSLEVGGAQMLPGMLDRAATIACWEELMGRPAANVEFYEVLAGFQFSLVMIRLAEMFAAEAGDESITAMAIYNPVVGITADKLGIPRPVLPTA